MGWKTIATYLLSLPPAVALATLVSQTQGAPAHAVTHEVLKQDGFFKWQGVYGPVSVSQRYLPQAAAYILRLREHHAAGSTVPALELPLLPNRTVPNSRARSNSEPA